MRDSLEKSQEITDSMVSILGSFDHRLSALESAMRPTQVTRSWRFSPDSILGFCFPFSLPVSPFSFWWKDVWLIRCSFFSKGFIYVHEGWVDCFIFFLFLFLCGGCFKFGVWFQVRTHAIRRAHENIDKTLKAAEVILAQFDLCRQVCLLPFL